MKILAIDDQQLVLLPLKRRLSELGYEVETETDALKAKATFDTFQPDLVIVDINMPIISGIEIIRYIRGTKNYFVRPESSGGQVQFSFSSNFIV